MTIIPWITDMMQMKCVSIVQVLPQWLLQQEELLVSICGKVIAGTFVFFSMISEALAK